MSSTKVSPALVSADEATLFSAMNHKQTFGHVMGELAEKSDNLAVVVSDYGRRLSLDGLRASRPEAYVQCGIAEQNQIEVASALANEGFVAFAPCYATFITSRVLDQVRVNLGMMRSPVALVGVSCGCEAAMLGASHMSLEDLAIMRTIPNLEVIAPADSVELASVLRDLAARPRPARPALGRDARFGRPPPRGGCRAKRDWGSTPCGAGLRTARDRQRTEYSPRRSAPPPSRRGAIAAAAPTRGEGRRLPSRKRAGRHRQRVAVGPAPRRRTFQR